MSKVRPHHLQQDVCNRRPNYREPRWERAVKVYTINQESKYLIVLGLPSVGAGRELVQRFALYGEVEEYRLLDEYPAEKFTDVYWIKFAKIQSARFAKKKLDNQPFFGGMLHVFYSPEYETVDETRKKLQERRFNVVRRCRDLYGDKSSIRSNSQNSPTSGPIVNLPVNRVANGSEHFSDARSMKCKPITHVDVEKPRSESLYSLPLPPKTLSSLNNECASRTPSNILRISSKQATLPKEVQEISVHEAYNIPVTLSISDYNRTTLVTPAPVVTEFVCSADVLSGNSVPSAKVAAISTAPQRRKQITWYTNSRDSVTASTTSMCDNVLTPSAYCGEPAVLKASERVGPWDPNMLKRKLDKSLTGDVRLDSAVLEIRAKLAKTSEAQDSKSPHLSMQKRTKNDGRKRI